MRVTVVDTLVDLGYRVLRAADGQSALSIVRSGAAIDLLLWSYAHYSFLPHAQLGADDDAAQPVLIAADVNAANRARSSVTSRASAAPSAASGPT